MNPVQSRPPMPKAARPAPKNQAPLNTEPIVTELLQASGEVPSSRFSGEVPSTRSSISRPWGSQNPVSNPVPRTAAITEAVPTPKPPSWANPTIRPKPAPRASSTPTEVIRPGSTASQPQTAPTGLGNPAPKTAAGGNPRPNKFGKKFAKATPAKAQPGTPSLKPKKPKVSLSGAQVAQWGKTTLDAVKSNWLAYFTLVWHGGKAAVQAFALTFGLLTLLVLLALLADSDSASWSLAFTGGMRFWLLAHGAGASFGELHLSIWPLGLSALCAAAVRLAAKRARPRVASGLAGVIVYALIAIIITRISGEAGAVTLRAALGALGVGVAGFAWALVPQLPKVKASWEKVPAAVKIGLRAAGISLLGVGAVAALIASTWAIMGHSSTRLVAQTLQPGVVGAVIMGVGQLFLLPNLLAWVMSWLAGPGFMLGIGSEFSPASWHGGPLPALPIMAAIPPQSWSGAYWLWVPIIVLGAGALGGWYAWRHLAKLAKANDQLPSWADCGIALGSATGLAFLAMFLLQWLARGSLGSGRLAEVGATPWLAALIFTAEIAAGMVVIMLGKIIGLWPARKRNS